MKISYAVTTHNEHKEISELIPFIIKYKDKDVNATVVAKDSALDLALLKADLRNTKYISFSNDQPKKLQRIIASG